MATLDETPTVGDAGHTTVTHAELARLHNVLDGSTKTANAAQSAAEATAAAAAAVHAATPHGRQAPLVHTQAVAAATWTVTHNLGYKPAVDILTATDEQMFPDVTHSSVNAYSVTFASPATGSALSR